MNANILSRFTPDLVVRSVSEIPLDQMGQLGIRGFLFDLDNTLLAHYDKVVSPDVVQWLGRAQARGFGIAMVTNAPSRRALPVADRLDMPCVYRARKPLKHGVDAGVKILDLKPARVAMVGDQLFTDVWAGRRVGTYTIWVRGEDLTEPVTVSFKRPLEWLITRLIEIPEHAVRDASDKFDAFQ